MLPVRQCPLPKRLPCGLVSRHLLPAIWTLVVESGEKAGRAESIRHWSWLKSSSAGYASHGTLEHQESPAFFAAILNLLDAPYLLAWLPARRGSCCRTQTDQ